MFAEVMIMPDKREERLAADYREMLKIQNRPYCSWIVTKGEPPYAEEYLLEIRLRSYILSATRDRYVVRTADKWMIKVELWDSYPNVAPNIRMLSIPPVFHPDWYSKGTYCSSEPWSPESSLKDYVKRLIGAVSYDPSLINSEYPANYKALEWFMKNRENDSLFPSDSADLSENTPEEIEAIENASIQDDDIIDSWHR